ncbi:unnamed protein product [Symbiodinium sp. CCMP2592]|nr:unnamed protein product [Symbiodinium sp. CCMP2592]
MEVLGLASFICLLIALGGSAGVQPFAAALAALLGWLVVYAYQLQVQCHRLVVSLALIKHRVARAAGAHVESEIDARPDLVALKEFFYSPTKMAMESLREWRCWYIAFIPTSALWIVRLVSDAPTSLNDSDGVAFWLLTTLGVLCGALESRSTLARLRSFRERAGRRSEESLDVELLAAPSAESAAPASATGDSASPGPDAGRKKDSVVKLLELVGHEWPLLIQASFFLVIAAIADVLIPHYVGETINEIIRAEERGTLASRPFKQPVILLLVVAAASAIFSACRGVPRKLGGFRSLGFTALKHSPSVWD